MAKTLPGAAALRLVPGLESGAAAQAIEQLEGGQVNDVWRVTSTAGRFVLRCDGPAWRRPGVSRARERALHLSAAGALLAPQLIAQSAALDVMVSEFVDALPWQAADFGVATNLELLGDTLGRLHALPLPASNDAVFARFDPVALARDYARAALRLLPERRGFVAHLLEHIAQADWQLGLQPAALAIVHCDLTPGNLLGHDRLQLIDWEYAQIGDPLLDVASVLVYQPAARAHAPTLLRAAGLAQAGHDGRLRAAVTVHDSLHWLWRMARGENVPEAAGNSAVEWAN